MTSSWSILIKKAQSTDSVRNLENTVFLPRMYRIIIVASHEHHGVYNHLRFDCLFNSLLVQTKTTSTLHTTGHVCWETTANQWIPVGEGQYYNSGHFSALAAVWTHSIRSCICSTLTVGFEHIQVICRLLPTVQPFSYSFLVFGSPGRLCSVQLGAVSIRKAVLPGMAIPMLKIRRPNGRLIFNMEITIRRWNGLYIEMGPWTLTLPITRLGHWPRLAFTCASPC